MSTLIKPIHTGISVYNMEESLKWYEKVLGFKLICDNGFIQPLKTRICFIQLDDFQLELFEYESPKPLPPERLTPNSDLQTVGTKHIAFEVTDMQALKKHFSKHHVDIALESQKDGNEVLFIRDLNGILIEFIKYNQEDA